MNRKTMYLIITVMSLSLIGIGIIQLVWFKASVDQDERNFSDKVMLAMGFVKERLLEDAQRYASSKDNFTYKLLNKQVYDNILNSAKNNWEKQRRSWELRSNELLINAKSYFDAIDKEKLDNYIKSELSQQGIDLEYDYGLYSTNSNSFVIINGNFVVEIGQDVQASEGSTARGLHNSEYEIALFSTSDSDSSAPGYLKIFFPDKERWLWSSVWPSILLSLLFTGLILFCFGYTLYVIVRQKMISEMKNDFINNMTHEFKTPIATISLATDSINNPSIIRNEEKIKRFTNIIKHENQRMLGQVEKVLQMAMIDKKEFEVKKDKLNLHEIIDDAVANLELKLEKRSGKLKLDLRAKDPVLIGDETHISNIINNLLDNAEKYSPDELIIGISTVDTSDTVTFDITDAGQGMTNEQKKYIFEKFYRAHTGNLHDVKGFGLGLSYVKAIVDAHGGTIQVKSEIGKGSTFSVTLPKGNTSDKNIGNEQQNSLS